jgi:hypothetical protein
MSKLKHEAKSRTLVQGPAMECKMIGFDVVRLRPLPVCGSVFVQKKKNEARINAHESIDDGGTDAERSRVRESQQHTMPVDSNKHKLLMFDSGCTLANASPCGKQHETHRQHRTNECTQIFIKLETERRRKNLRCTLLLATRGETW